MLFHVYRLTRRLALTLLLIGLCAGLGNIGAQDAPLYDPFTTTNDVSLLRAEANLAGGVRVIVGLRADYAEAEVAETQGASDPDSLRRRISRSAQEAVLTALEASRADVDVIRRFPYIPYMVLRADAAALDALAANPLVTSIESDALAAPDMQSSALVIGASGRGGAWELGYTGAGAAVAVLDTGVDKNHPALSGRVVSEACYNTNDTEDAGATGALSRCPGGVESSTDVNSGLDCVTSFASGCEHGTHVAGTVASTDATNRGIAPDAALIAINVFSYFPSCNCVLAFSSDQIDGLNRVYALRETYTIAAVNMSLGGGFYTDEATCDAMNEARKAAIDLLRGAEIATVISSGNGGAVDAISAPGCISTAVSVGATDDDDNVASFSNAANLLELFAPGVNITSTRAGTTGFYSSSGTSMASPHVAGAWAVMRQAAPEGSIEDILNAFTATGVTVTDQRPGGNVVKPRLQLNAALLSVLPSAELLVNGSFDDNDSPPAKIPDNWNAFGQLKGDKVRVDGATVTSYTPSNTFQFVGKPGEKTSKIAQPVDLLAHSLDVGDMLILSAYVDQRSGNPNAQIGQLVVMYSDDSPNTKVKLRLPAVKTAGYVGVFAPSITLTNTNIRKISVQLLYTAAKGKFYIDDVSLLLIEPTTLNVSDGGAGNGMIPVPAAPGDLRGQ